MSRAFAPLVVSLAVPLAVPLVCVSVAVCGAGCAPDFLPASVVVNERVIAVVADPPEAAPGQQVTLTPTVVAPQGTLDPAVDYLASWWRCPDDDATALQDNVPCTESGSQQEIGEGAPYVDDVPTDLFGELDPDADEIDSDKALGALLGYWRAVGFRMQKGDRRVDAFKRVPIYLPTRLDAIDERLADLDTRINAAGELEENTNPTLSNVVIHKDDVTGGSTTKLQQGKTYAFEPIYDARTLQAYFSLKVDFTGLPLDDPEALKDIPVDDLLTHFERIQRCEIPTFSWFVTHGRVRRDTTIDESVIASVYDPRGIPCPALEGDLRAPEALYTPPTGEKDDPMPKDGTVYAWVVMRDGRGGTAVRAFSFKVEK